MTTPRGRFLNIVSDLDAWIVRKTKEKGGEFDIYLEACAEVFEMNPDDITATMRRVMKEKLYQYLYSEENVMHLFFWRSREATPTLQFGVDDSEQRSYPRSEDQLTIVAGGVRKKGSFTFRPWWHVPLVLSIILIQLGAIVFLVVT